LAIVILGEPRRGERPAGDAPQQQRAHGLRIFQREQHGEPAAGRAAAEDGRQRIELRKERVEVLRPDFVFGEVSADGDIGKAAVAAVVDEHAVAGVGDVLRQRFHIVERAAAARRERDPRAGAAEDLVIDVHSAHLSDEHRRAPY
jgi:hypothetical protein